MKKTTLNHNEIIKKNGDWVCLNSHSSYHNVQDKVNLASLRKNLINKAGVYSIVHNETKKLYIGSSMNLARRLLDHINNQNSNIKLQRAISKYGLNNFSIYILELLPADLNSNEKDLGVGLIKMEQKYLNLFSDKYNINPEAGKTRLGAKHSEATKELMSKLRKENPHFLNKSHKEEFISKIRARMSGCNNPMFGRPVTNTNKKLISDLFSKSVYLYEANSLRLIAKYDKHKDLIDGIKISPAPQPSTP